MGEADIAPAAWEFLVQGTRLKGFSGALLSSSSRLNLFRQSTNIITLLTIKLRSMIKESPPTGLLLIMDKTNTAFYAEDRMNYESRDITAVQHL